MPTFELQILHRFPEDLRPTSKSEMKRGRSVMATSRWQSRENYDPLKSLDRIDLAWEFIRRNPDYRLDYRHAQAAHRRQSGPEKSSTGIVIDPVWGLSYCLGSQTWCATTDCVLVSDDPCCGCALRLY